METVPLDILSPSGNREQALDLIRAATGLPLPAAHTLVVTLDAVSAAVLRTAGVAPADGVRVLSALWQDPERLTDTPAPRRVAPQRADAAAYLLGLGERVHVIRRARRLTANGVGRRAGIEVAMLRDLEAGTVWPTLPMLLRLAAVFGVPVAMLVDEHATPLRILRLLAAARAA